MVISVCGCELFPEENFCQQFQRRTEGRDFVPRFLPGKENEGLGSMILNQWRTI